MAESVWVLPHQPAEVLQAAPYAFASLGWRVEAPAWAGAIEAVTRMGMRSWGERVCLIALPHPNGCQLTIKSRPRAQLFDWGKSTENVERAGAALAAVLAMGAPAWVPVSPR